MKAELKIYSITIEEFLEKYGSGLSYIERENLNKLDKNTIVKGSSSEDVFAKIQEVMKGSPSNMEKYGSWLHSNY